MSHEILKKPINYFQHCLNQKRSNVFVLIDVNSKPHLRGELFNQNDNPEFRCLFHGTILEELRDRAPYLLKIKSRNIRFLQYLFEQAPDHFMVLISNQDLDTLFHHWQSLLTVYGLDGKVVFYKLYTPQVLGPYVEACRPSERATLLYGINELYLNNELDQWQAYYKKESHSIPYERPYSIPCHPELASAWWQIKEHHLANLTHLTEASLLSNMEDYMTEYNMELLIPYKSRNVTQMIHHGIRRARFYGITTRRDFAFFIGMMFEVAPNFDEHPVVHQWLNNWDLKSDINEMADDIPQRIWIEAQGNYDNNAWNKMQKNYQYTLPDNNTKTELQ